MRFAAALLALALAGCHDEDELVVINTGAEPVLIDVEWHGGGGSSWDWDWDGGHHHRFVELPAGGIYKDEFGLVGDMDVVVFRKSDGLILFAADFDADDFADDHGQIQITVTP